MSLIIKRKQRSPLWNYFTKIDGDKALCNLCKHAISYKWTITNLKGHLRRKHITSYTEAMSRYSGESNNAEPLECKNHDEEVIKCEENIIDPTPSTSTLSNPNVTRDPIPKRQRLVPKIISLEEKKLIDRDLLDLFIKDFQPFSIVEDIGFSKLMKWIPGYELPGSKTISTVMIPNLYNECLLSAKDAVLRQAESVCITADCWATTATESYISITGHYITKEFDFKSILLKCSDFPGSHSAANLAEDIRKVITEWKLQDKVNYAVSDNSRNIASAFEDVLKWNHYGCYAHTLNLMVQRSLLELQPILDKIKNIVGYFKKNSLANENLLKYQMTSGVSPLKRLVQDVATRWNSTLNMVNRFVELNDAINNTISTLDTNLPVMTSEEWQTCRQLCEILSPFEEMTKSMGTQRYMTGSSVIVITRCLKGTCDKLEKIKEYSVAAKNVISSLKKSLQDQFKQIEHNSTFALCTLLDPRYKYHVFEDHWALEKAKTNLQNLVVGLLEKDANYNEPRNVPESQPAPTSSGNISAWCILNELMVDKCSRNTASTKAFQEIDSYFKDDILPRLKENGENTCPFDWWKKHQYVYPNISEIFRTRCNVVATSMPRERLFSKTGNLIGDRNTRLTSKRVEMITFLNANAEIDYT